MLTNFPPIASGLGTVSAIASQSWASVGLAASMHALAASGSNRGYAEVDTNPNPLREEVFPTSTCRMCRG